MPNLTIRIAPDRAEVPSAAFLTRIATLLSEGMGVPLQSCNVMTVAMGASEDSAPVYGELVYRGGPDRTEAHVVGVCQKIGEECAQMLGARTAIRAFPRAAGEIIAVNVPVTKTAGRHG
jgi:hypothetical protein